MSDKERNRRNSSRCLHFWRSWFGGEEDAREDCEGCDLSDMNQENEEKQPPTPRNRKNPTSRALSVLVLTVNILGIIAIIIGLVFYFFFRQTEPDFESSTTVIPTTRFHRYPSTSTEHNTVSDNYEEEESNVTYKALIYTDHPQCTDIGRTFLLQGGNAQDAAIAAMICLSAAHPHKCGLGGGLQAIISIPNNQSQIQLVIDARETASYRTTFDQYLDRADATGVGITSVGAPSFLIGLHTMYITASGKFLLEELTQPTIALCNSGILVDDSLAAALQKHRDLILNDYMARDHFVNHTTNDVYKKDDRMYCPKYSQTLSEIIEMEHDNNYIDPRAFAEQMSAEMEETGGFLNTDDFLDFITRKSRPKCVNVGGYKICGPGAPSTFAITALTVGAAQASSLPIKTIFPLAYRDIKLIGDPDMDASNITVPRLFEEDYLKEFVQKLDGGERAALEHYDVPEIDSVLIADEFGRTTAVSSSIGDMFGSRFYSRLGFFYNNAISSFEPPQAAEFTGRMDLAKINTIEPGKAPRTYLAPVLGHKNGQVNFITSGVDIMKQVETIQCLMKTEDCKPSHALYPSLRRVEGGWKPLSMEMEKVSGY